MGADGAGVSSLFDDHQFLTFADSRRRELQEAGPGHLVDFVARRELGDGFHRPNALWGAGDGRAFRDDSHFHLTNYIQEGADIHGFLKIRVPRWDGLRCSEFRCSSDGLMRTPVTSLLRITSPLYLLY